MSIRRLHDVRDEAEAIAIVDEFLRTQELSSDVRQKLLQSRDGLWPTGADPGGVCGGGSLIIGGGRCGEARWRDPQRRRRLGPRYPPPPRC